MNGSPLFHQVVMPFTIATSQKVSATLQAQLAIISKRDSRISTVNLLL